MPRQPRRCPGGVVYHVWNRAAGRLRLFKDADDFAAFNRVLIEAQQRHPIRILDWCLMPNHWHFVVWPRSDTDLSQFFRWLTLTHAMRAIRHRRVMGMGPLYQCRFKSLPVQSDEHLSTLLRYVLRNPLRAGLVKRAQDWRWSGLQARRDKEMSLIRSPWPIPEPDDWNNWLNLPQAATETDAIREHIRRSRPYGSPDWVNDTATRLEMGWTLAPHGGSRNKGQSKQNRGDWTPVVLFVEAIGDLAAKSPLF